MTHGPAGVAGFGKGKALARRGLIALVAVTASWCVPAPAQESIPDAVRRMEQTLREMDLRLREMELGSRELSRRLQALEGAGEAQRPVGSDRRVGERFRDCDGSWCPELVVVPAGKFEMGSPEGEAGRSGDEGPVHEVEISEAFAVGVYEVTRGEFGRFVRETGHSPGDACLTYEDGQWEERTGRSWRNPGHAQTDGHPVVCVSWEDAREYVEWLSRKTGQGYRLLSESEWEYVARAGTGTSRYWGDDASRACRYGNVADRTAKESYADWSVHECSDGYVHTSPVGRFEANGDGLHDVLGNVWEWVEDCWHGGYRGAPSDGRAWLEEGGGDCSGRVLRGGSWERRSEVRAFRESLQESPPDSGAAVVGFRVARTLD